MINKSKTEMLMGDINYFGVIVLKETNKQSLILSNSTPPFITINRIDEFND